MNASCRPLHTEDQKLVFDNTDLRIVRESDSLFSDSSKWNRTDDRKCDDDIAHSKYSLFCALYKASVDDSGTYEHRRAAMQEVRFIIDRHSGGHVWAHRLMDWNNSPETSFADLKQVLREAMDTIASRLNEAGTPPHQNGR